MMNSSENKLKIDTTLLREKNILIKDEVEKIINILDKSQTDMNELSKYWISDKSDKVFSEFKNYSNKYSDIKNMLNSIVKYVEAIACEYDENEELTKIDIEEYLSF